MKSPDCSPIHLAIVRKPYLDLILSGAKSLEFRLTKTCIAPFARARPGDVVYFKQSGGPYRARAQIEATLFVQLGPHWPLERFHAQFQPQIQADDAFWQSKQGARYASLIWLKTVERIERDDVPEAILALPVSRCAWRVVDDAT